MRYDLLPNEVCNELLHLLDYVSPVPYKKIRLIIDNDLGSRIEKFDFINVQPLGAASIAQVHQGKLITGEKIVVKILRPGIKRQFEVDFIYLRLFTAMIDLLGLFKNISTYKMITELITLTREEFNFRREAGSLNEMHELMERDDVAHYAPKVYFDFCSANVITMELIEGTSIKDIILALETKNQDLQSKLEEDGISLKRSARIIVRSILEQSMRHRLYHVDPHAGNLIVMKDGTLAWIDFGMLGWLDEKLWTGQYRMRKALVKGNIHEAYLNFLETLEPLPRKDLSFFETSAKECFRDWINASKRPNSTLIQKSSGFFFSRLLVLIRNEGLSMPTNLIRLYRSIIIADIVSLKLYPELDWVTVMEEFIQDEEQRLLKAGIADSFNPYKIASSLNVLFTVPRLTERLFSWFETSLPELRREYNFQANRFFIFIKWILRFIKLAAIIFLVLVFVRLLPISNSIFGVSTGSFLEEPFDIAPIYVIIFDIGLLIILSNFIRSLDKSS